MATIAEAESRINAMESRLAVSEAQNSNASSKLEKQDSKNDAFSDRLARLEERVAHLPSKDFVVKTAVSTLLAIAALLGLQIAIWKATLPPTDQKTSSEAAKPKQ